jgi:phosphatidylglycerophosphatase A
MNRSPLPHGAARLRLPVLIASGLGSGFSRFAPGTTGSLIALLPGILLSTQAGLLPLSILAVCVAGLWAIPRASGGADHGWVVIDEVAGQWITLLGVPPLHWQALHDGHALAASLAWLLAAFLMFRLLDITKPSLIGTLDRRHDAIGVMGDDVLAGIVGAALLGAARMLLHAAG